MTQRVPPIDPRIESRLAQLKPVYDDIKEQQAEFSRLIEARAALDELDRALAEEQRSLADTVLRHTKLVAEEKEQQTRADRSAPSVVIDTRRRILPGARGSGQHRPSKPLLEAPPPAASPKQDRVELTNFVRRFLRYSLSMAHPEILAEFNRIMNSAERPVGEGLAVLDWELAFCQPLGVAESADTQKWAERLDRWGMELEKYRTTLISDIERLRPSVESTLSQLDAWRSRATDPGPWTAQIEDKKASIRAKRQEIERESEVVQDRITQAKQEQA